ncbi:MAG: universal stress protein [Proteobacteria bacterium]|nr:universal stress protein [Pseudomonadota bacterium]
MSQQNRPFTIVAALDLTEMTDAVLAAAAEQAALRQHAVIHAVCVIDDSQDVLGRKIDRDRELEQLENALRNRIMASLSDHNHCIEVHARAGRPAETVVAIADAQRADLIVLGRHSQTPVRPLFLGSVPSHLLGQAPCNVLVVQPSAYGG